MSESKAIINSDYNRGYIPATSDFYHFDIGEEYAYGLDDHTQMMGSSAVRIASTDAYAIARMNQNIRPLDEYPMVSDSFSDGINRGDI